jgi:hypothetical protein
MRREDAAALVGLSPKTLSNRRSEGRFTDLGEGWYWRAEVEAYAAGNHWPKDLNLVPPDVLERVA